MGSSAENPETVVIPPWAFLRTMAAIAWTTLRHPLSVTTIDLSTGRVIEED